MVVMLEACADRVVTVTVTPAIADVVACAACGYTVVPVMAPAADVTVWDDVVSVMVTVAAVVGRELVVGACTLEPGLLEVKETVVGMAVAALVVVMAVAVNVVEVMISVVVVVAVAVVIVAVIVVIVAVIVFVVVAVIVVLVVDVAVEVLVDVVVAVVWVSVAVVNVMVTVVSVEVVVLARRQSDGTGVVLQGHNRRKPGTMASSHRVVWPCPAQKHI
mmetsp:Transcript_11574/g.29184  ORF Transcript_11574/g.29184 Transcript_11574/m.29184 type:complete len:218 (+) Transcript_11574:330-983(+)